MDEKGTVRMSKGSEHGLTLIEVLTVMALFALLLTLGGSAFRYFWLQHALDASQAELISQLRQRQEQAVSESHPLVFGVRVEEGSSEWGLVEYRPDDSTTLVDDQSCVETTTLTFSTGVRVQTGSVAFAAPAEATWCASNLVYSDGAAVPNGVRQSSAYVLFYPRGTATGGSLTLEQPATGRVRGTQVTPITGRVDRT